MARRTVLMIMIGLFATRAAVLVATAAPPAVRTDLLGDPLPDGALVRVGTVRFRHAATIITVAYAPDSKRIATGGRDGTVRIWDAATGRQLLRIPKDGALFPLDEESEDPHALPIAYSPDGKRLATPGRDNTAVIHDAATGREVQTLRGLEKPVAGLAFAPDGKTVFAMDKSQAVRGWDQDGKERLSIPGRKARGTGFALSPDGKTIATGGEDGARLWDAARGAELVQLTDLPKVLSLAFSPDGGTVAVGAGGISAYLFDRAGGRRRGRLDFEGRGHPDRVAFSPDGKTLASCGREDVVLCDVASGEVTARLAGLAVAFSPDGKALAVGSGPALGFADLRTGREKPSPAGHTQPLWALAFAPDGKTLATAGLDRSVRFWDAATGKETTGRRGKVMYASGLAFTPDGRRVVAGAGLSEHRWSNYLICVWDADTGREQPQLYKGHSEAVHRVLFAPDGKECFTASAAGSVGVWDPATAGRARRGLAVGRLPRRPPGGAGLPRRQRARLGPSVRAGAAAVRGARRPRLGAGVLRRRPRARLGQRRYDGAAVGHERRAGGAGGPRARGEGAGRAVGRPRGRPADGVPGRREVGGGAEGGRAVPGRARPARGGGGGRREGRPPDRRPGQRLLRRARAGDGGAAAPGRAGRAGPAAVPEGVAGAGGPPPRGGDHGGPGPRRAVAGAAARAAGGRGAGVGRRGRRAAQARRW
jgi:WD40 repeat protein